METDKDHFQSPNMALQKAISKKMKPYFQEKIKKNANNSKELWQPLKPLGMKSGKVNQNLLSKKMVIFSLNLQKMKTFLRIFTLV